VRTEQFSMSQHVDSLQFDFEVVNAVTVNISCGKKHASKIRIWISSPEEYERSASEE
jgi:hypothetical protein